MSGTTPLPISSGGTGASTQTGALTSLNAANVTLSNVSAANRNMSSTQLIQPLSNSVNTYTADIVNGVTTSANTREFLQTIQYTINQGANTQNNNRVATYWGIGLNPGSGAAWARNVEIVISSGSIKSGLTFVMGDEIDIENQDTNIGAAAGAAGFGSPSAYGSSWGTGAASGTLTAATIVNTVSNSNRNWQRGHVVYGGVTQESFSDYGTATNSYVDRGTHSYGVNLSSGSYSASAIIVPNNSPISANKSSGSGSVEIARADSSNNILVANGSTGVIGLCTSTIPTVDNGYNLGQSGQRFSSIWAANGTIQTSDPSLKTEMAALPDVSALFVGDTAIVPVSFKWKSGGLTLQDCEEEREVEVYEEISTTAPLVEIHEGIALYKEVEKTQAVPVYDEYRLYSAETREPILTNGQRWSNPDQVNKKDDLINSSDQVIHRHERKEKKVFQVKKPVEHAGRRTHVGWDAKQWSHAASLIGIPDFGGYVEAEDGTLALRPDQIIPVLWKQVQTLTEKVMEMQKIIEFSHGKSEKL